MPSSHADPTHRKPLRLWPGIVAAALLLLLRFAVPAVVPDSGVYGVLGAIVFALLIVIWWAFFSRAPRLERLGVVVLMIAAVSATRLFLHPSIATGMMGMMFFIYGIPILTVALVLWAVATRGLADGPRRGSVVAVVALVCGAWTLLRTDGLTGEGSSQLAWRWSPTHEDRLLAVAATQPLPPPAVPAEAPKPEAVPMKDAPAPRIADWPGFRGPLRDGVVRGVRIAADWSASPPVELWRREVGPGWSSFAVDGGLIYTQEQRGEEEIVACYRLTTGEPVWAHREAARFWESNGGAGPRGTPTLDGGRVYTLGATGIVNALNAATGALIWSRNAASDTDAKLPGWGFSGSPLVVGDQVIVATSGQLVAYDRSNGSQRWLARSPSGSYSSPHLFTIGGVPQIVMLTGAGAAGISPSGGKILWRHEWKGASILQPAITADGDVLLTTGDMSGGVGIRRIKVTRAAGGWTAEERWTSKGLKPYFNDFVVHKGHAFGFDGRILSCIGLEDGERKWKGGRYGQGQMVALPDQDLLLVLSEEGELALVKATPDQFTEVARVPAIEGKTWNHPVLVRDVLLVRNGEQMAAFRLTQEAEASTRRIAAP